MAPSEFDKWVKEVKDTAPELTESEFNKLLETAHVGRQTYSSTHLDFRPAPEGENAGHHHGGENGTEKMDHSTMDHSTMDHSNMDMTEESSEHEAHN